jgi:isoleucyl-tRNA synthetase
VLEVTARVAAPLLPLTMEKLWQGLTGGRSVHLADWPAADLLPRDDALVATMERVRQVASAALSLRKARGLRVRLPLAALTVAAADAATLAPFADILRDEVNVKEVVLTDDVAAHGRFEVAVNARVCGPRLGGDTQKVIRAVKAGEWSAEPDGTVTAAGITLRPGEFTERLVAVDAERTAALPGNTGLVLLDTVVTPELAAEGAARDVVRVVQQARRDAGLDVSDRITLVLEAPETVGEAVRAHEAFVAGEVLATTVTYGPAGSSASSGAVTAADGTSTEVKVQVTPTPGESYDPPR